MEFLHAIQASDTAYRLGWALLHTLWLGAGVAVLFATAMRLLRRRSANARYLAGCLAMALMVAMPVLAFVCVSPPTRVAPVVRSVQVQEVQIVSPPVVEPAPLAMPIAVAPSEVVVLHEPLALQDGPAPTPVTPSMPDKPRLSLLARTSQALEPTLPWVVLLWAAGVALLALWQLAGWIAAERLKRLAVQPVEPGLVEAVARLARAMHVSPSVKVLQSVLVKVPAVLGWLRPVILLPVGLATGLTPAQVEAILAHELAHIRRYDYLVNLLQSLAETLLFYHPAIWFISGRIRAERENCCDDAAVSAGAERFSYAESLLHVAEQSLTNGRARRLTPAIGVSAAGRPSQLRRRVRRLLGGPEEPARWRHSWPIALVVVSGIVVASCLLATVKAEPGKADLGKADLGAFTSPAATQPAHLDGIPLTTRPAGVFQQKGPAALLAFSPDGRELATCDVDEGIRLVEVPTGRLLRTIQTPGYSANSMTFSPDGSLLAAGTNKGEVRIWDARTLELRAMIPVDDKWNVHAIAMSADGSTLAATSTGPARPVALWNCTTGQKLQTLGHQSEDTKAMTFAPDGKMLVTVARDGRAEAWDVATGRSIGTLPKPDNDFSADVCFCPDGKRVAIGREGSVSLWDPASGQASVHESPDAINPKRIMSDLNGQIALVWPGRTIPAPSGTSAASITGDGWIAIWDIRPPTVLRFSAAPVLRFFGTSKVEPMPGGGIEAVTFSADGKTLATGDHWGHVEMWTLGEELGTTIATQPASQPASVSDAGDRQAQIRVAMAQAAVKQAQARLASMQERYRQNTASEAEVDHAGLEAEMAQLALELEQARARHDDAAAARIPLAQAMATLENAKRYMSMVEMASQRHAASQTELDDARAKLELATLTVKLRRAELAAATASTSAPVSQPATQPAEHSDTQFRDLLVGKWLERANPRTLELRADGTFEYLAIDSTDPPSKRTFLGAGIWETDGRILKRRIERCPDTPERVGEERLVEVKTVTSTVLELRSQGGYGPMWDYDRIGTPVTQPATQTAPASATTPATQSSSSNVVTRVYDIRDLAIRIRAMDCWNPEVATADTGFEGLGIGWQTAPQVASQHDDPRARVQREAARTIITLIREKVEPGSWQPAGPGVVALLNNQLVITQTPQNQEAILDLLKRTRSQYPQIQVMAQFIHVSPKTDAQLLQWLANQPGVSVLTGQGSTRLSAEQTQQFIREAQKSNDSSTLTAPRMTLFNRQGAFVHTVTLQNFLLPLLDEPGKSDVVRYSGGTALGIKASASGDMVSMEYKAAVGELSKERPEIQSTLSQPGGSLTIADGQTALIRPFPVSTRYRVLGVRRTSDPATGKATLAVRQDVLPAAEPEKYLYILITAKIIREVQSPTTSSEYVPTTQPATQPAGKLEFRIVPNATGSSRQPVLPLFVEGTTEECGPHALKELAEQGPGPARQRGDEFQWFPLAAEVTVSEALIGEYQGKKYILLSTREPYVMLPGEGETAWGLTKVHADIDNMGKPAVAFELDSRGGSRLSALTKANINNTMAMLVDGQVVFAPAIRAQISGSGIIEGQYTQQRVQQIVQALATGMPASAPASAPTTQPATAPASAPASQPVSQPAWGETAGDIRMRLALAEPPRRADGWPQFRVDFRNGGKQEAQIVFAPEYIRFQVDGVWYRPRAIPLGQVPAIRLQPGYHGSVEFWPATHWEWRDPSGQPLNPIAAGKHAFRLEFAGLPNAAGMPAENVLAISNLLEVDLPQPATQPATGPTPSRP